MYSKLICPQPGPVVNKYVCGSRGRLCLRGENSTVQTDRKAGKSMDRYEEKELQQEMEQVEKYLSDCLRDPGYGGAVGNILRDMQMSKGKRLRPRLLRSEERRVGKECRL